MKYAIILFISILFFLIFTACNQEELEEKMVQFDQAFIPVWYYVQLGNFTEADQAFLGFEDKWKKFKRETRFSMRENNKQWKSAVQQMDLWITDSRCAIDERDIDMAINQLDHARYEMIDWRWRAQMNYYLDYVWDLESSIDVARSSAIDPMLNLLEWNEFQVVNEDIQTSWENLQMQTFDPDLLDFSEEEVTEFINREKELGTIIKAYLHESKCLDTCQYEEAVDSLYYAFLSYLKVFGDFKVEV